MLIREVFLNEKERFNTIVKHVIQSWQWGDAKEATGAKAFRFGVFEETRLLDAFQITIHTLPQPLNNFRIGYMGRCTLPTPEMLQSLHQFGEKNKCIFIKIEPNIYGPSQDPNVQAYLKETREQILNTKDVTITYGKEIFPRYNFLLNLNKPKDELLAAMHEKTRYNIGLAQRKEVKVIEKNDEEGFQTYVKIYFETVKRQGYYGHDTTYHREIWSNLSNNNMAHILIAYYDNTPITAWLLLHFHKTLYYPYGGSLLKHRNVMASNLVAWEAIKLGKKLNCEIFDMWGAMGINPDPNDPWYGFHKFKSGYNPEHVEYLGTFDLIINPQMYKIYLLLDKWRSKWLKIKAKLRLR